jgi:spore maturation protein CgeB
VIGYSPDDMTVPWNTTPQFFRTLSMYDAYVTTKSYGVTELTALGARKVVFSPNGFDPLLHRPCSDAQGNHPPRDIDIGFIGAYEAERARSILSLCNAGLRVSVYGSGWEHLRSRLPGFLTVNSSVMGPMYAQSLCRFRIALGFLRKINRDLQTTRSVEIPACGVFMLAERSEEHRGLFREGLEADYFGSDEELITKARYYLQEPVVRERIAAAGRERAVNGRYSYAWRLVDVLRELQIEPPHLPAE